MEEWTQITIYVPPLSDMVQIVTDMLSDEQFRFNMDTVAYERADGTVADFAPCPPLAR